MPGGRFPSATFSQFPTRPDRHDLQGGSMPRIAQFKPGFTVTRSSTPNPSISEPVSVTRPTISCPGTHGKDVKGDAVGMPDGGNPLDFHVHESPVTSAGGDEAGRGWIVELGQGPEIGTETSKKNDLQCVADAEIHVSDEFERPRAERTGHYRSFRKKPQRSYP